MTRGELKDIIMECLLEEGYIDTDIQESINPLSVLLSVLAVEIGVISFLFVKFVNNQKKFLNEFKNS